MRGIIRSIQFKRDVKLAKKRGKDMAKLRELILLLEEEQPLPSRYRDHPLRLLLYKIDGNDLYLVRTGTHADLF